MPHITLEFTDNVSSTGNLEQVGFNSLFARVHRILHEVGGINIGNCKSRALKLQHYHVGDDHEGGDHVGSDMESKATAGAFVHLDICFLEGRSHDVKTGIGEAVLAVLLEAFQQPHAPDQLQITVEIRDIQARNYFKYPAGTLTMQGADNGV